MRCMCDRAWCTRPEIAQRARYSTNVRTQRARATSDQIKSSESTGASDQPGHPTHGVALILVFLPAEPALWLLLPSAEPPRGVVPPRGVMHPPLRTPLSSLEPASLLPRGVVSEPTRGGVRGGGVFPRSLDEAQDGVPRAEAALALELVPSGELRVLHAARRGDTGRAVALAPPLLPPDAPPAAVLEALGLRGCSAPLVVLVGEPKPSSPPSPRGLYGRKTLEDTCSKSPSVHAVSGDTLEATRL